MRQTLYNIHRYRGPFDILLKDSEFPLYKIKVVWMRNTIPNVLAHYQYSKIFVAERILQGLE